MKNYFGTFDWHHLWQLQRAVEQCLQAVISVEFSDMPIARKCLKLHLPKNSLWLGINWNIFEFQNNDYIFRNCNMAVSNSYPYPGFTNPYLRGKLPPVKTRLDKNMCAGRIFIFIILGVILLVFGLVSVGVYLNVNGSTSSSQYTEIMPLYITSGTVSTYSRCDYCFKM